MTAFQSNVTEQSAKYSSLNKLTGSFIDNFRYHLSPAQSKVTFFENFRESSNVQSFVSDFEKSLEVLGDIIYFFKRKRSFYDNYKKLKLKNRDNTNLNSNVTVNNQKEALGRIEEDIKTYNKNLLQFLQNNVVVKQNLEKGVQVVRFFTSKLETP